MKTEHLHFSAPNSPQSIKALLVLPLETLYPSGRRLHLYQQPLVQIVKIFSLVATRGHRRSASEVVSFPPVYSLFFSDAFLPSLWKSHCCSSQEILPCPRGETDGLRADLPHKNILGVSSLTILACRRVLIRDAWDDSSCASFQHARWRGSDHLLVS